MAHESSLEKNVVSAGRILRSSGMVKSPASASSRRGSPDREPRRQAPDG